MAAKEPFSCVAIIILIIITIITTITIIILRAITTINMTLIRITTIHGMCTTTYLTVCYGWRVGIVHSTFIITATAEATTDLKLV